MTTCIAGSSNGRPAERRTVAAVLEDAVRVGMAAPESHGRHRFVLVPTGEGGLQPGVELSSNAALRELLDEGLDVDMLR